MEWNDSARPRDPGGLNSQNYNRGLGLRLLGKYEDLIAAFKQSTFTRTGTLLSTSPSLSSAWVALMRPKRR